MTQDKASSTGNGSQAQYQKTIPSTYYSLLGLKPSASVREIRQAYRELSKLYHPDTTQLSAAIATAKFQQLNEAYATLSNVERRTAYDQKIGYSRVVVSQPLPSLNQPQPKYSSSAYLDPTDRPLSPGELFALFILGITFLGCLILAIAIGITRGDAAFQPITAQKPSIEQVAPAEPESADSISLPVVPAPAIEEVSPTQSEPAETAPSLVIPDPAIEESAPTQSEPSENNSVLITPASPTLSEEESL